MLFNQQGAATGGSVASHTVTAPDEGIVVGVFEDGEYAGTEYVDEAEFPEGVIVWYDNPNVLSNVDVCTEGYPEGGAVEVFEAGAGASYLFAMPPCDCWIIGD